MTGNFTDLVDLASERMGGAAVAANDEFFAPRDRLVLAAPAVWREGDYTERGKWMDGWETRRRREVTAESHDWCIVRLGAAGIVHGVDVDTSFFKGNYPASCAIDGCTLEGHLSSEALGTAAWRPLLPRTPLQGDTHNLFELRGNEVVTHVRLRIYPDGGVARLRAYGEAVADWTRLRLRGDVDLAAAAHGGVVVACSDMFFGSRHNLIMPGDATHMGDGWETRRRRGPGYDWTIVRLGARGTVRRIEVDTRHFKGNAPGACSLDAFDGTETAALSQAETGWKVLLPRTPLHPHAQHTFEDGVKDAGPATHVRFNIFPDGGIGRLRLYGRA